MKTFQLDANEDLKVVDRRFVLTRTFGEALVLRIRNAFVVVRGEFGLDTRAGFAYYPFVAGVKAPNLGDIRSLYLAHLLRTEGVVAGTIEVRLETGPATRRLIVDGTAIGDDGTRIQILDGQVFLLGDRI